MNIWGGDAGKFYETFTVQEVIEACALMLDDVTQMTQFDTVTVLKPGDRYKKTTGHLGGKLNPKPPTKAPISEAHKSRFAQSRLGLEDGWLSSGSPRIP